MKKHPYITATIAATLLAIVVWLCMPKEYTAITKLSDEYKEVDLAIGLDKIQARINELHANDGINDMEVYCKFLKTKDFARTISHKQIPGRRITFGEYLADQDTIETILDNINYNYSNKYEILTIGFTDHDPVVAALMLNIIVEQLQKEITHNRQQYATKLLENTKKELVSATNNYKRAQQRYSKFVDSNTDVDRNTVAQETEALKKEVSIAYDRFEKVSKECIRQESLRQRSYCSFSIIQSNRVPVNDDSHLIGYIICFVTISLLLLKATSLYKKQQGNISWDMGDIFSPWSITVLIWFVILLLLAVDKALDPLSSQFIYCLAIWISIFCPVSFLFYNLNKQREECKDYHFEFNNFIFNLLFVIAILITPLYLYEVYKIVTMFDTEDMIGNIRTLNVGGNDFGILNYAFVVDEVILLLALWNYPKIPKWKLTTIIIIWFMYAIACMAKGYFFMIFIYVIYVLYERKNIKIRTIGLGSLFIVVLFYFFNLARGSEDYAENETFMDFVGMYIMSGAVAFGRISQTISENFGSDVLWIVYYYISKITNTYFVHQQFQNFVFIPIPTNVFTIFRPYFADFGYRGVAMAALIYGALSGYVYKLSRTGNAFGICMYTYFVYVLSMQFFDDVVIESSGVLLQFIILLYFSLQKRLRLC